MSVGTEHLSCHQTRIPGLRRSRTEPVLSLARYERSGSGNSTLSSLRFDQQLDKVALWMEQWNHQERCSLIDALLSASDQAQIQLLWTVIQPALHRDFMYTAKKEFPKQEFVPISSFYSRKLKERQVLMREDNYHRINSAHIQHREQLRDIVQDIKLPEINQQQNPESNPASVQHHVQATTERTRCTDEPNRSPCLKRSVTWSSVEMPPRRHIQEDNIPIYQDGHQGSSLSSGSLLGLRERKKHREYAKSTKTQLDLKKSQVSPDGQKLIDWYIHVWDDCQRNEFLSKILYKLDPRQHYYISGLLSVKQYKDFISHLPEAISLRILAYLSARQLLRASKVCKKWRKLCNNNEIWRVKCQQGNIAVPTLSENPKWKKLYYDNKNIKDNWDQGKCSIVNCKGHTDRVLCVTFDDRRMATGSVDKTIRIWDLDSGECVQTLLGHLKGVWCIKFFTKHLLISGSYDSAIKIWNLRDAACVRTLLGHEGSVWAIVRKHSILASGSQDRTARIWDASRCYLLYTLKGHRGAVYCIDMDDDAQIVVTGSSDKTVRLWSVVTGVALKVILVSETASVMAVSYSQGHFACSYGGKITLYKYNNSTRTAKVIRSYHEHRQRIESLLLKMRPNQVSGHIVSGGRDGELKYWDVNKEKSIQSYRAHGNTINCVHCDEFRITTASYDNKIKIWDFRPS